MTPVQKMIADTHKHLEGEEWRCRFAKIAECLSQAENGRTVATRLAEAHALIRDEIEPMRAYINIGDAERTCRKRKGTVAFDVRYCGQSVAGVDIQGDQVRTLRIKPEIGDFFGDGSRPEWSGKVNTPMDWYSPGREDFFRYFRDARPARNKANPEKDNEERRTQKNNEEHRIEHLFWERFASGSFDDRATGLFAVDYGGVRMAFPTPITASGHQGIRSGKKGVFGGGIDLFLRRRLGKNIEHPVVMEIKQGCDVDIGIAVQEAIAYSVFIRELLSLDGKDNNHGQAWRALWGFPKDLLDSPLPIDAIAALPEVLAKRAAEEKKYPWGEEFDIPPGGADKITLHLLGYRVPEKPERAAGERLFVGTNTLGIPADTSPAMDGVTRCD